MRGSVGTLGALGRRCAPRMGCCIICPQHLKANGVGAAVSGGVGVQRMGFFPGAGRLPGTLSSFHQRCPGGRTPSFQWHRRSPRAGPAGKGGKTHIHGRISLLQGHSLPTGQPEDQEANGPGPPSANGRAVGGQMRTSWFWGDHLGHDVHRLCPRPGLPAGPSRASGDHRAHWLSQDCGGRPSQDERGVFGRILHSVHSGHRFAHPARRMGRDVGNRTAPRPEPHGRPGGDTVTITSSCDLEEPCVPGPPSSLVTDDKTQVFSSSSWSRGWRFTKRQGWESYGCQGDSHISLPGLQETGALQASAWDPGRGAGL